MKYWKVILGVVLAALLAVGCVFVVFYYNDNKKPNFSKEYVLCVRPNTPVSEVLDSLKSGAGVLNMRSLERAFSKMDVATKMQPGRYVIDPSCPSIYAARMLVFGWQTPAKMTLSGTIRSKGRLAKKISTQMMVDSVAVDAALNDEAFLAKYGFTPENVFGMIIPDTYEMYWTASVEEIFDRFKKEYDSFWTPARVAAANKQNLSRMQVSILASIVSGETLKDFEYPRIAGVYLNRYRKGIKLQADPTVCFCFNYELDRVLKKHLSVDSPYNTYKYVGLPPAPINVPPKACIDAVLNPESHSYIYFCASPAFDGTHRFAVGYGEHMRNAREFQRELTARRKAKAAAEK